MQHLTPIFSTEHAHAAYSASVGAAEVDYLHFVGDLLLRVTAPCTFSAKQSTSLNVQGKQQKEKAGSLAYLQDEGARGLAYSHQPKCTHH
eukprot:scaffold301666_cov21-Tisochrysis_lutea.AAC.1